MVCPLVLPFIASSLMRSAALQGVGFKPNILMPRPYANSRTAEPHATIVLGAHGEAGQAVEDEAKHPTADSATSMEFGGNGDVQMLKDYRHDVAKADEATQEHKAGTPRHNILITRKEKRRKKRQAEKDLAHVANCTKMHAVEAGWCEEACTDENSAVAKASGLEVGTCLTKGFSCFLHAIACGVFVKAEDNEFANMQSAGVYEPDTEAALCNVHHLEKHGTCEEFCIGFVEAHAAHNLKLTNGACNEIGYVKFIGQKRMKTYSTPESPIAKEVEADEEILEETAKYEKLEDEAELEEAKEEAEDTPEAKAKEAKEEAEVEKHMNGSKGDSGENGDDSGKAEGKNGG